MTQTFCIDTGRDRAPITYGADKPPTVEERQARRMSELHQAELDLAEASDQIGAAHAELDRLDVPRGTWDGNALGLVERIRYMVCGSTHRDAQPRLLQSWAPEVWSGRRHFGAKSWEPAA